MNRTRRESTGSNGIASAGEVPGPTGSAAAAPTRTTTRARARRSASVAAALAVAVAGLATGAGGLATAASPRAASLARTAGRSVEVSRVRVTSVDLSGKRFSFALTNRKTHRTHTYTIEYSATTDFHGASTSDLRTGILVTATGHITGSTITASSISIDSVSATGPYAGLKYVGNV